MSWFTFSLCSVLFLGVAELTQQNLLAASKNVNERSSAVVTLLFQTLLTIPLIFVFNLEKDFFIILKTDSLPWLLAVALLGSFAMILYLRSFKVSNISFSCIFISWSAVVSSTLGIVFFSESLTSLKILGILFVLIAIFALNFKNFQLERNHLYALQAGALFGVIYTIDKKIVLDIHPVLYMFWIFLLTAAFGLLYVTPGIFVTLRSLNLADARKIAFSGICYTIFNYCAFSAYLRGGEVGRVDAINNCQVFLIILVEYFIFRQKTAILRKLGSAVLAVAGIFLLSI